MYKHILSNKIDWARFFNLVEAIGDKLDGPKDRFDKSDIFEESIQHFSDGSVLWVNEVGHDHLIGSIPSEMKTQKNCLFTKAGNVKNKTSKIKLMNSLGDCSNRKKDDVIKFDYLMIVDTGSKLSFSVAFIHKEHIQDSWLDFTKDGVILQIPTENLTFVVNPKELKLENNNDKISYIEEKAEARKRFINCF